MVEYRPPDFDIDHVEHSVGGFGGHAFRRLTHISMAVIPILYYTRGEEIAGVFSLRPDEFVSCLLYTSPSPRDRQKSRMPSSA